MRARMGYVVLLATLLASTGPAGAATPSSGALKPDSQGKGRLTWTGRVNIGTAAGGVAEDCFDAGDKPDATSGCDFFALDVTVPSGFYSGFLGGADVTVSGFGAADVDLGVFKRHADGTRGPAVTGSGNFPGEPEQTTIGTAQGSYYLVVVPYAAPPGQSYNGVVEFNLKKTLVSLTDLNRRLARPTKNYRASHDRYISHSEPHISLDPRNHDHLIAASKMYENLEKYFFKVGTYESFDGGRTWRDYGHLPGYCEEPGQCDPNNDEAYRVVSDPVTAFDDEGNAYVDVLDAPGGTAGTGWNINVHIKRPGRPWGAAITVHDNRAVITSPLVLDDKNWIAVDNATDVHGGPNKPGDGKVGTIYSCWSMDAGPVGQQIVLMRSLDGGKTWGGVTPGDNTPYQLSQRGVISGIGCQISIGPRGEVYVIWYDNVLDGLMEAKSTNRGQTFTPATPIATILGVNESFEGQSFRNLSVPSTAVAPDGTVYASVASCRGEGAPVRPGMSFEDVVKQRELEPEQGQEDLPAECEKVDPVSGEGQGDRGSGADIVLFKSTDGGDHWTGPVRVNQDPSNSDRDQFQPALAVTPKGQLDISYFDRRNDPNNFFIDTYLSRSNDGGKTFGDTRVTEKLWDARINPPISPAGEFIGDYQGLVADDEVAIPFWNDTQAASLPSSDPGYSPWQQVVAGRVPNVLSRGGACLPRRARVHRRSLARIRLRARSRTVAKQVGGPTRKRRRVWRYCVNGGGKVLVVFSRRKRVVFISTTARRHRRGKVHRGTSLRRLRRVYRRRGLTRVAPRLFRSGTVLFGVRRGKVRFVALASARARPGQLRRYLRRARL